MAMAMSAISWRKLAAWRHRGEMKSYRNGNNGEKQRLVSGWHISSARPAAGSGVMAA